MNIPRRAGLMQRSQFDTKPQEKAGRLTGIHRSLHRHRGQAIGHLRMKVSELLDCLDRAEQMAVRRCQTLQWRQMLRQRAGETRHIRRLRQQPCHLRQLHLPVKSCRSRCIVHR